MGGAWSDKHPKKRSRREALNKNRGVSYTYRYFTDKLEFTTPSDCYVTQLFLLFTLFITCKKFPRKFFTFLSYQFSQQFFPKVSLLLFFRKFCCDNIKWKFGWFYITLKYIRVIKNIRNKLIYSFRMWNKYDNGVWCFEVISNHDSFSMAWIHTQSLHFTNGGGCKCFRWRTLPRLKRR